MLALMGLSSNRGPSRWAPLGRRVQVLQYPGPEADLAGRHGPPGPRGPPAPPGAARGSPVTGPIPEGATWVRFPRFVGDAAMQLPVLRLLRTLGVGPLVVWGPAPAVALVDGPPLADAVVPDQGKPGPWAMAALLRRHRAARSIHFPKTLRPALAAFLARVPERIGVDESLAGLFNTHSGPFWDAEGPFLERYHAVLARRWPDLPPMPFADYAPAASIQAPAGPYLCLMPGSTWPSKAWPREHFLALARQGPAGGLRSGGAGHPGARRRSAPSWPRTAPGTSAAAPPSSQAAAWLRGARAALGNDSGLSHLAAACSTPTLALYGATDPGGSTPWGPRTAGLRLDGIPCAPCFKPACFVAGHPCLAGIDPRPRLGAPCMALVPRDRDQHLHLASPWRVPHASHVLSAHSMRSLLFSLMVPALCAAQTPHICLEQPHFDFGKIPGDAKAAHRFKVTNKGTGAAQHHPAQSLLRLHLHGHRASGPWPRGEHRGGGHLQSRRLPGRGAQVHPGGLQRPGQPHRQPHLRGRGDAGDHALHRFRLLPGRGPLRAPQDLGEVDLRQRPARCTLTEAKAPGAPWLTAAIRRQDGKDAWVDITLDGTKVPPGRSVGTDAVFVRTANPKVPPVNLTVQWEMRASVTVDPLRVAWVEPAGKELRRRSSSSRWTASRSGSSPPRPPTRCSRVEGLDKAAAASRSSRWSWPPTPRPGSTTRRCC